jgi:hypothetical protein
MFKLILLGLLSVAFLVTSPLTSPSDQGTRTNCVPELSTRQLAEVTRLPEYPEETEPGSSKGVVFAAVLFGIDGRLNKIKFYETPNSQASDAVKKALKKWKLKEIFGGGGEPTMTRTAIRFHFVFQDGKGRVEMATEEEQKEFGWRMGQESLPHFCR